MKHNRWKGFRKVTALMLTAAVAVTTIDSSCYMTAEAEGNTENSGEVTTGTTISQDYSTERLTSNYTHVSSGYSAAKYTGEDISYAMEDVITKKEQLTEDNYDYHGKVADISHGDEVVALPGKVIKWEHKELIDKSYRYGIPLMVQLEEGTHEVSFTISADPLRYALEAVWMG